MIPWIPLSVLSDLAQPRHEPVPDDVLSPRNPLGFSDVRSEAAIAPAPERMPFGFAPTPRPEAPARPDPAFRTELSFRRTPTVRAEADAAPRGPHELETGHAASEDAAAPVLDELWPGEPSRAEDETVADEAHEEKTPFYKKELGLFRRKSRPGTSDEPAEAEAIVLDDEPQPYEVDLTEELVADEPELEVVAEAEPVEALDDEPAEILLEDEPVAEASFEDDDAPALANPVADEVATGDLWGEADDDLVAVAPDDDAVVEPAEDTVVSADAGGAGEEPEPVQANGRSRFKSNGEKPKRKSSGGRGERGGRKVVGLKIGASQLAAAVVQQVEGRSELVQAARVPLEPGIVVDGDVRDKVALASALKSFFEDNGLPRKDVRIGLASNRIGVRTSDVVGIDDDERFDNAVRFKAHEVLPVAVHESVLDYRVIDERASEEGESLRRVLLVVAPRDQVEPYLEVCSDAGLRLAGIDLEALGLLRAFVEPRSAAARSADDTATVVASIGHESSTLLVAGGGACEFTRVFDWGGAVLQEAVAQELDVHAAEASTILRHLALSGQAKPLASLDDDARQRALDAVRSKLTPFARELVSSLQFYQTQPDSLGIGEIVITGGTSHLVGLADSLHQMIGVNVRVGDPLQRVVARSALDSSLEATIGSLAVPIGLAIEDDAMRSVNLLPSELRQSGRKKPDLVRVGIPVAIAASVAAVGFMFLQANSSVSDNQAQLDAVQAEIAALPKPKRPVIDANVEATEAARAVALAGVLGGRVSWDRMLREVALVLPGNISLTGLSAQLPPPAPAGTLPAAATPAAVPTAPVAPTGVTIDGYTKDQRSVALLLARLRTVPSFTNVQLQTSTRELVANKPIVRFTVLADVKQPGGTQ
jgi:type IV pilus assembly protein PilM